MFKDRIDAALQLSEQLQKYKNKNGVVLAIPRGGVPIGYVIAKELGFELEIILSKKIGHPRNPEYAIGSVSLDNVFINDPIADVSMEYINHESERILNVLKSRYAFFMGNRKMTDLKNKTVILVDDGIATGSTIIATLNSIRKKEPKEIIIAVPVAPQVVAEKIQNMADEFICLYSPANFSGIGQFYEDFSEVTDEEVIELLRKQRERKTEKK